VKQLWAPWRLEYIAGADEEDGCIFCRAADGPDDRGLVVHRGASVFCLLNRYPYASGHLMVAPYRHVGEFGDLTSDEVLELHRSAA
jgi:ATP adenylyltransferase